MREHTRRAVVGAFGTGLLGAVTLGLRPTSEPDARPTRGRLDPAYRGVERAVVDFADRHGIHAAAWGVVRDGRVRATRTLGWLDRDRTTALPVDGRFRIASVTKAVTAAATRDLLQAGNLSLDDPVLPRLDVPVPEDHDPRLDAVTVRHLLTHRGGWDRRETFDPMFAARRIARALSLSGPPDRRDVCRFMFDRPLAFEPGTRYAYSNFGYAVLGTLLEDVTGRSFEQVAADRVLAPAEATGIRPGRTLPADRPPTEVAYGPSAYCPSAVDPYSHVPVHCPDGGFVLETMDCSGGLTATVADLLALLSTYTIGGRRQDGTPPRVATMRGTLYGSLAVAAQPRPDTVLAALFNRRPRDHSPLPAMRAALPSR